MIKTSQIHPSLGGKGYRQNITLETVYLDRYRYSIIIYVLKTLGTLSFPTHISSYTPNIPNTHSHRILPFFIHFAFGAEIIMTQFCLWGNYLERVLLAGRIGGHRGHLIAMQAGHSWRERSENRDTKLIRQMRSVIN